MDSVIGNPFVPLPKSPKSHTRGWAEHWGDILGVDRILEAALSMNLSGIDFYYFDHGVNNEPGRLNLFGGVQDELVQRVEVLIESDAEVISLDHHIHADEYCTSLQKRLDSRRETSPKTGRPMIPPKSLSSLLTQDVLHGLHAKLSRVPARHLSQEDFVRQAGGRCVIGDSHATSFAKRGWPVIRQNGLTLYGALGRDHFKSHVRRLMHKGLESVTLVAGSIDVRHHLCRLENPRDSAMELVDRFIQLAEWLEKEYGIEVELGVPVPVEYEGRRIPRTGWYRDSAFYGSVSERKSVTDLMHTWLTFGWERVVSPPQEWYSMDPEEYAKTHMELATSVHISPTCYRKHGGWAEPAG